MRPIVGKQMVREFTYAYGAFCPKDGASSQLILPAMNGQCMNHFLHHVRQEFPQDYILMVMDGAPCHRDGVLDIPQNMQIQKLPPRSPELNPSENIWRDMREKFFLNTVFNSMSAVEKRLCKAMKHYAENPETVQSIAGFSWINLLSE